MNGSTLNWCDEKLGFGKASRPTEAEVQARLAALSMDELVRAWREESMTSLKDQTAGTLAVRMYFDRLAYDDPDRALAFLEDLIPAEDGPVVDEVVAEAARNPRFRHLLGGVWFSGLSLGVVERLEEARGGERW